MKKAVIAAGGKQYLVSEGETLEVELLKTDQKIVTFESLLVIDNEKIDIGRPVLENTKVRAEGIEPEVKAEKVIAIRYKSKKRVHKIRGHRQRHSRIKITSIK